MTVGRTIEEIQADIAWKSFVEQVKVEKIALGVVLGDCKMRLTAHSTMAITVPDEFSMHAIRRSKDYLEGQGKRAGYAITFKMKGSTET